jgi:hypothetical protein
LNFLFRRIRSSTSRWKSTFGTFEKLRPTSFFRYFRELSKASWALLSLDRYFSLASRLNSCVIFERRAAFFVRRLV